MGTPTAVHRDSVTVVALVLGSFGMEPPRETRFQGALVGEVPLKPMTAQPLTPTEPSLALKELGPRPDIGAGVGLVAGFGTLVLGAAGTVTAGVLMGGWTGLGLIMIAGVVGAVCLVPFIIGIVLLTIQLAKQRAYDAKAKQLTWRETASDGVSLLTF